MLFDADILQNVNLKKKKKENLKKMKPKFTLSLD